MAKISPEEVRTEVKRFWDILSGRSQDKLEEMYAATALVFTGKAKRSESARLAAVRRTRQIPKTASVRADLSAIEVQISGDDAALAAYTYSFRTTKIQADGTRVQVDTPYGRATQVFQRDDAGALRIIHEHLSAAAPPAVEKGASGE